MRRDLWQPEDSRQAWQVDLLVGVSADGLKMCPTGMSVFLGTATPRRRRRAFDLEESALPGSGATLVSAYHPLGDVTRDRLRRRGVDYAIPIDVETAIWTSQARIPLAALARSVRNRLERDGDVLLPSLEISLYALAGRKLRERVYLCRQPDGPPLVFVTNLDDVEQLRAVPLRKLSGIRRGLDAQWQRLCELGADRYHGRTVRGHAHHVALVAMAMVALETGSLAATALPI